MKPWQPRRDERGERVRRGSGAIDLPPGVEHATLTAYSYWGCGCLDCTEANYRYKRDGALGVAPAQRYGRSRGRTTRTDPRRVLRDPEIGAVKALYAAGGWTHRSLGERFGVSRATIRRALHSNGDWPR